VYADVNQTISILTACEKARLYFCLARHLNVFAFFAAPDEVKKVLSFPCKHCNMKFAQIRGLKVHIRHNHLKLSM
jgi:hypothetical protein